MNDVRNVAQVSTDTRSAIGGTRISEAATPAVAAGNRASTARIVGGVAMAYAASDVLRPDGSLDRAAWAAHRKEFEHHRVED